MQALHFFIDCIMTFLQSTAFIIMIANNWMVWFIQHDRHRRKSKNEAGAICISDDGHTQV